MSEHLLDKLRRIQQTMKRWDDWWWWDIMKNVSQADELRCAIRSWAESLSEVIVELEDLNENRS